MTSLRNEHEAQMRALRCQHEDECIKLQEELDLQKSKVSIFPVTQYTTVWSLQSIHLDYHHRRTGRGLYCNCSGKWWAIKYKRIKKWIQKRFGFCGFLFSLSQVLVDMWLWMHRYYDFFFPYELTTHLYSFSSFWTEKLIFSDAEMCNQVPFFPVFSSCLSSQHPHSLCIYNFHIYADFDNMVSGLLHFLTSNPKFYWFKKKSTCSCKASGWRKGENYGSISTFQPCLLSGYVIIFSSQDSPFLRATQTPVSKLLKKVEKASTGSVLSIPKHHKKASNS